MMPCRTCTTVNSTNTTATTRPPSPSGRIVAAAIVAIAEYRDEDFSLTPTAVPILDMCGLARLVHAVPCTANLLFLPYHTQNKCPY